MPRPVPPDLHAVLAGLRDLDVDAAIDPRPGTDWVPLTEYATGPDLLEAGLRLAGARFGRREVSAMTGGWLVGDVATAIAVPAAAALLATDTELVPGVTEIRLPRPDLGQRHAIRFTATRSATTPTPASFAARVVDAVEPVVEGVHRRTRRGRHALWGTVTDAVVAAFDEVGGHLDRRTSARGLAAAVVDSCPDLVGRAHWHDVAWSGGTERTRISTICCLSYRTSCGACLTCPRISTARRRSILEDRPSPT